MRFRPHVFERGSVLALKLFCQLMVLVGNLHLGPLSASLQANTKYMIYIIETTLDMGVCLVPSCEYPTVYQIHNSIVN